MEHIIKTIRLPGEAAMKEFVDCQSNFSGAIKYLIIQYIRSRGNEGIEDLNLILKNEIRQAIYQPNSCKQEIEKQDAKKSSTEAKPPAIATASAPIGFSAMARKMQPAVEMIPDCYT